MQIPTFFDLTTPAIKQHAELLKKRFVDWKDPSDGPPAPTLSPGLSPF